jgi:hypothetical protein
MNIWRRKERAEPRPSSAQGMSHRVDQLLPRRRLGAAVACTSIILANACTWRTEPQVLRLEEVTIDKLARSGKDPIVVLLIAPTECMACNTALPIWLEATRHAPYHAQVILTALPSPGQRRQMILFGITPNAILAPSQANRFRSSTVIVLTSGTTRATFALDSIGGVAALNRRIQGALSPASTPVSHE